MAKTSRKDMTPAVKMSQDLLSYIVKKGNIGELPEHLQHYVTRSANIISVQPPNWKGSKTVDNKTGNPVWLLTWQKIRLRIEKSFDPNLGVIFDAFVDGKHVIQTKYLETAQIIASGRALSRFAPLEKK